MLEILINTSPIYITIILGAIFKKYKIVPENASKTIGIIAFKIIVPFLVFNVLYGLKFTSENIGLLAMPVLVFVIVGVASLFLAKLLKMNRATTEA